MVLLLYTLLQSNKKEKEPVPTETKNDKELEMKPVASESSEKPKLSSQPQLQPQPPSSPAQSESRRSGGKAERGVKRCLKNKPACDKATTDSVGVKVGAGDGSTTTTSKPITVTRGEQQPQEPSAKRTIVRLPKTPEEATSPADRDTHSVKSTANGKAPHTHLPAGRSPQTQRRGGDNRAERLGSGQEQKPGGAVTAASHTNKTQVRKVVTSWLLI